jgi:hypothetical protein
MLRRSPLHRAGARKGVAPFVWAAGMTYGAVPGRRVAMAAGGRVIQAKGGSKAAER